MIASVKLISQTLSIILEDIEEIKESMNLASESQLPHKET
jgi:hypothetical protein